MKTLEEWRGQTPDLQEKYSLDASVNEAEFAPEILDFGVGIEVEVENCKALIPMPLNSLWIADKDPSLRNNGIELKTHPLGTRATVGAALGVLARFVGMNKGLDFSWRTSIHVHLDLSKFTLNSISNLNLCYLAIEPLLFKVFAPKRKDSIYCVPLYDAHKDNLKGIKTCWTSLSTKKDINWGNTLSKEWPVDTKYSAINYYRVNEFGTVEFRHLSGTSDVKLILRWIQALQYLMRFAHDSKYATLVKRISQINTDSQYHLFLKDVFGPMAQDFQFKGFEEFLAEGVRKTKFLLFYNNPQSKALVSSGAKTTNKAAEEFLKKKKQRFERDFPFGY